MRVLRNLGVVFLVIGLPLFVGSLYWAYRTAAFVSRATEVTGNVARVVEHTCETSEDDDGRRDTYPCYQPIMRYDFQGKTYESAMSERSADRPQVDSRRDLLVDGDDPTRAEFAGAGVWVGPIVIGGFGLVFGTVGGFMFRSYREKKALVSHLERVGVPIEAKVIFCGFDESITVNGRHPFRVDAQWTHPLTGEIVVSQNQEELWHDPSVAGQISESGTVQVKYDPQQPGKSMVVLSPHGAPRRA